MRSHTTAGNIAARKSRRILAILELDRGGTFKIGEVVEPIAMQTGQVRKEHYAYAKLGSCTLFAAIEPGCRG